MAQIVIFAPSGEDVSAGEQALKDAGHDVEVVEATPENLLHMTIGMLESGGSENEEPKEAPSEEDPLAEPAPEEEEAPAEEEDPKKMESVDRVVTLEGERVVTVKGSKTGLFVHEGKVGERSRFTLNESQITTWGTSFTCNLKVEGQPMVRIKAPLTVSTKGQTYFVAGPELHHLF